MNVTVLRRRLGLGLRLGALAAALLATVGAAGWFARDTPLGGTWLTAALGPTAYVVLAHPHDATSRLRNGAVGHAVAILVGLAVLAAFGLWDAPSIVEAHGESWARIVAQAVAVAVTLLALTVADAHHAPAAASALLVASGIARPGPPLAGLVIGLAVVLAIAPLLARLPGLREDTADADARETPMG